MNYELDDVGLDVIAAPKMALARIRTLRNDGWAYTLEGKITRPGDREMVEKRLAKDCVANGLLTRRADCGKRFKRVTDPEEAFDYFHGLTGEALLHRTSEHYFDLEHGIAVLERLMEEENHPAFRLTGREGGMCMAVLDFLDMDLKGKTCGAFGTNDEDFGAMSSGIPYTARPDLLHPFLARCEMLEEDRLLAAGDVLVLKSVAEYLARIERGYRAIRT